MDSGGQKVVSRTKRKTDLTTTLRKAWFRLRLSVRHPTRVPTWDAIVLTAASPEQAELYQWQLMRAKRLGRIAKSTVTLAVPDPDGQRIGSGAATLNAIYALTKHYESLDLNIDSEVTNLQNSIPGLSLLHGSSKYEVPLLPLVSFMGTKHILLLHAGGDSKRVPWANPMGKVFLPLPYLAADEPDGPVPLLFDHILAISCCIRPAFKSKGGILIMTGDVLPCFDASTMILQEDCSCIVTVPVTLDIAANHGVIVASESGIIHKNYSVNLVENLLQKPSVMDIAKNNGILDDGRALLDTGIIAVCGKAWMELVVLACSSQAMVMELLKSKQEMSLYEDLVAAWVPTKHKWLQTRAMGEELVNSLGKHKMFSYCAHDLLFLHFGTSSEILDHLSGNCSGIVDRRHLCSFPATTVSDIAASSVILSSKISPGVSVGEESIIYDSSISSGMQVGSQSIVVGVSFPGDIDGKEKDPFRFMLPDRHCLWEVPLVGCAKSVMVYCGLHDNPKSSVSQDGTFCGKPWKHVLNDLSIQEADLWSSTSSQEKCLWNAKIFPILSYFKMLSLAVWLMGLSDQKNESFLSLWKNAHRVSLEELHRSIDYPKMCVGSSNRQADLAAGIAKACIDHGLLGRNLSQLCAEIVQKGEPGIWICKDFLNTSSNFHARNSMILRKSRAYQVQVDLLRACGNEPLANKFEHKVWDAVANETASAVRYGFLDYLLESSGKPCTSGAHGNSFITSPGQKVPPKSVKVELPVRVDFVGGWSDTPPWSLERAGCVLNMAINLEGSLPVGTVIETTEATGLLLIDDLSNQIHVEDFGSISAPFDSDDPFRLVKAALLVTGIIHEKILQSVGLKIQTWANVPRGSGLGTSSILAASVVKGLLKIIDGDDSNEIVARLVLVLEQLMGTGGGWQDQIGGLYPGIKLTTSFPGIPLRLQVFPLLASPEIISELQQRLLVVFTGQVRLAHRVLQKVVARYLQRDSLLISSIKRLAELAKIGREALMNGEVDELGEIMLEAWRLHQELDPYCSNELVDRLFEFCDPYCCGYKLVGAGGGGFALLLARNAECSKDLKGMLEENLNFQVKVYSWSVFLDS